MSKTNKVTISFMCDIETAALIKAARDTSGKSQSSAICDLINASKSRLVSDVTAIPTQSGYYRIRSHESKLLVQSCATNLQMAVITSPDFQSWVTNNATIDWDIDSDSATVAVAVTATVTATDTVTATATATATDTVSDSDKNAKQSILNPLKPKVRSIVKLPEKAIKN
jgi:hypothetical protein